MHLAMLLRLDEIGSVAVIVGRAGGGSGLGAAREDVCSDLMRSRHRVSKLLLRQGIRVIRCHWFHRAGCLSWGPLPAPRPAAHRVRRREVSGQGVIPPQPCGRAHAVGVVTVPRRDRAR